MEGKYIPTHASKAKKPATMAQSDEADEEAAAIVDPAMAMVALANITVVKDSVRIPLLAN